MKLFKRITSVLVRLLLIILALLVLAWTGLMIAKVVIYREYMSEKETVCTIPDIHGGYVPQGLAHVEGETYLFSGYHKKDLLSLYLVENNKSKKLIPVDETGAVIESHGGGVANAGDFVYVSGEERLLIFSLADFKNTPDGGTVSPIGVFPVDTAASFCFADDLYLYVGEYYKAVNYEIDLSHSYTTPAGDQNRALVSCYPLAADGSIADAYPLYSISVTGQVQGFARVDDTFILSTSWGLSSSELLFYHTLGDANTMIDISGKSVPLYYLDSSNLEKTMTLPAFSEELDIVDGRVIVSFESACNKYIVGKLFFADKVISLPIPNFEK